MALFVDRTKLVYSDAALVLLNLHIKPIVLPQLMSIGPQNITKNITTKQQEVN